MSAEPRRMRADYRRERVPKERYLSPAFHALEWERMWTRVWLLAGPEVDVARPGAVLCYEIGPESILIVRQAEGSLKAFYNTCRHRGTRLCEEGRAALSTIRCPYHGWEWQLDGEILRVTDAPSFAARLHREDLALKPVRCGAWGGFVWVCMDEGAPPLLDYLGEIAPLLSPYRTAEHALVRDVTVEWPCNWKLALENDTETYHIQAVHPALLDVLDDREVGPVMYERHSQFVVRFGGERRDGMIAAQREALSAKGISYPGLDGEALIDNLHCHVFPNTLINIKIPGYWASRVRPHLTDPAMTYFDFQVYERLPRGVAAPPRPPHERYKLGDVSLDNVLDQDAALLPKVQKGLCSRGFSGSLLGQREARLIHMHEVLDRYCFGDDG